MLEETRIDNLKSEFWYHKCKYYLYEKRDTVT